MYSFGIENKSIENIFEKFQNSLSTWLDFIQISFISKEMKGSFIELILNKFKQLDLV